MNADVALNPINKVNKSLRNNQIIGNIMPEVPLKADLEGKVKNLPHFKANALLPVFEAVVNSIHAIEERNETFNISERGNITVKIIRERFKPLTDSIEEDEEKEERTKIIAFEIEDDGIGFDEGNFDSFCTADTTYKSNKGCKGIGRFVWLKAFDKVEVDSIYSDNGSYKRRKIDFSLKNKKINEKNESTNESARKTIITLKGFKKEYQNQNSAFKTKRKIAQRILEHNLSYYIGGEVPLISVTDEGKSIFLDNLFDSIKPNMFEETISIGKELFNITHLKLPSTTSNVHKIVLCADNREVISEPVQKHLDVSYLYDDEGNRFYYAVYVSSDYLDAHVNSTRTIFDIDDQTTIDRFSKREQDKIITVDRIINAVLERSKEYLLPDLQKIRIMKEKVVADFVKSNPSLRSIPKYCPEIYDEIQVNSSEDTLTEVLYKYKGKAALCIKREHDKLLKTQAEKMLDIKDEVRELTKKIETLNRDNLAEYLLFRKKIIDLFERNLEKDSEGNYKYEKIIHDIIFPRKTTSDEIDIENINLWLIDESLIFHQFAVSDLPIDEFSSSESESRPDVFICCEKDRANRANSISIIEFKRPGLGKKYDPVDQIYTYIDEILGHGIKLENGRIIRVLPTTRFYCYAILDPKENIAKLVKKYNFVELNDSIGYYLYNSDYKANVEILAFDKILDDVKKRHDTFFNILGI
jgi:hypothetical protein